MRKCAIIFTIAWVLTGCGSSRDSGTGGAGGTAGAGGAGGSGGTGGSGGGAMVTTVHALRTSPPASGTIVSLQNVVVIGRVASSKNGQMWVQDAGGGMSTGIELFCNYGGHTPNCTQYNEQSFQAFSRGQVVNVTATYKPFTPTSVPAATVLELDNPTITPTGQTMDPVATSVTADMIAKTQVSNDMVKGTYVKVTGPVTIASAMATEFQTACAIAGGDGGMSTHYNGFDATAGSATLAVALSFYETVNYCLPDPCFPPAASCTIVANQTFQSVSGVVEAGYDSSNTAFLRIAPVVPTDLPVQ